MKSLDPDSRLLQAIADPLRLRIVRQLAQLGSVCACDIAASHPVSQPTVSHHLRVLRDAGWVETERRGTWIYYSLRSTATDRLQRISETLTPLTASEPSQARGLPVIQPGA